MQTNQTVNEQAKQAVAMLRAIAETIRECGSAPEGIMYAGLMGRMDLSTFEKALSILQGAGLISRNGHVATWTGPKL